MTGTERFWAKVNTNGPTMPHMESPCWVWVGRLHHGYGSIDWGGRDRIAHRHLWAYLHGDPGDLVVCHRCDNAPCVRPDHMFLGTNGDNIRDAVEKGRIPQGEQKPSAKLTKDQVREIRAKVGAGATKSSLSREYGVHRSTIIRIARYEKWRSA